MHTRHCLLLADPMNRLLLREIGQGLDRQRLLREPLYARDVLLVCDAIGGAVLPGLAQQFRQAAAAEDEPGTGAAAFSASNFFYALFGQPAPSAKATR